MAKFNSFTNRPGCLVLLLPSLAYELVATAVCPIFVATGSAVKQEQQFALPFDLIVQIDAVE